MHRARWSPSVFLSCVLASASACDPAAESRDVDGSVPTSKADDPSDAGCWPEDPEAIESEAHVWACLESWGNDPAPEDFTPDAEVASTQPQIDYFACVDGVVYGTAGALASIGLAGAWGGAIVEPTPAGEAAASVVSAPIVGFLGGVVAVKLSGSFEGCVLPFGRLMFAAAWNGFDSIANGIGVVLTSHLDAGASTAIPKIPDHERGSWPDGRQAQGDALIAAMDEALETTRDTYSCRESNAGQHRQVEGAWLALRAMVFTARNQGGPIRDVVHRAVQALEALLDSADPACEGLEPEIRNRLSEALCRFYAIVRPIQPRNPTSPVAIAKREMEGYFNRSGYRCE